MVIFGLLWTERLQPLTKTLKTPYLEGEAVNGTYVDSVKDMNLHFVYYHYIQPVHRRDRRKWKRSLSSTG